MQLNHSSWINVEISTKNTDVVASHQLCSCVEFMCGSLMSFPPSLQWQYTLVKLSSMLEDRHGFLINGTTSGDHFKKNSWFELVRSTRSSSTRSTTTTKRRRQWSPVSVSRHDNGEEEGCVFHPTRIGHLDVLVRRGNRFLRGGATPLQLQRRGSIAARVTRQFKCSPLRSQCDNRENCLNGSLLLKGRRTLGINLKWNVKKKKNVLTGENLA